MVSPSESLRLKYTRANALVASVLNKFYNGSARAVDPFVIRCIQEEETRLFSIQCYLEEVGAPTSLCIGSIDALFSSTHTLWLSNW